MTTDPTNTPIEADPSTSVAVNDSGPSAPPARVDATGSAAAIAFQGFKLGLRSLEKSADAFPPLKSAAGGLLAVIDAFGVRVWIIIDIKSTLAYLTK